jgi:hypothetical protein
MAADPPDCPAPATGRHEHHFPRPEIIRNTGDAVEHRGLAGGAKLSLL